MDTWLTDVKQLRIPRPKFGSISGSPPTSSRFIRRPYEPPRDYQTDENSANKLESTTEELRTTISAG